MRRKKVSADMINTDEYQKYIESIVRNVAHMFEGFHFSEEDLRQRGWLELLKAVGRYSPKRGAKFTTYAYTAMREGIKEEALFQMNHSGITGKERIAITDCVSIDEEKGAIESLSEDAFLLLSAQEEDKERKERLKSDLLLLTEEEKKVLDIAYGIGCERCANAKKIAKMMGMRELEVKKALESGKRKLRELSDGRK